jgi:predicted DNA-binding protein
MDDEVRSRRSVTLRLSPELWDSVERLAREDRRPVAQLVRNLIEDAVAESGPQT